jgi:hypothetical protein
MAFREGIGENGKLDDSVLKPIDTGQKLYKPASTSFMRMKNDAKKDGVDIKLVGNYSGYRPCGQRGDYNQGLSNGAFTQWYAWELYKAGKGNLASNPTTEKGCKSNHGYGIAIDVKGSDAKKWVRKNGEKYGWWWGEAPSEDWHFTYDKKKDTFLKESDDIDESGETSSGKILKAIGFATIFLSVVGFAYGLYYFSRTK